MMPRRLNSAGVVTLYFAMIFLPVVLLIGAAGFGVATYFAGEKKLQLVLDAAVGMGAGALPAGVQAEQIAISYARPRLSSTAQFIATSSSDSLSLRATYQEPFNIPFADYFLNNGAIPVVAGATARVANADVIVALDVGAASAPTLGEDWGGAASQLFLNASPYQNLTIDPVLEALYGRAAAGRFLTERCFNERLALLKSAAILLSSHFANSARNNLGIYLTPSAFSNDWELKPLGNSTDIVLERFISFPILPAGSLQPIDLTSSDFYCLAIGEHDSQYNIPGGSQAAPLVDPTSWLINEDNLSQLRFPQGIWSSTARGLRGYGPRLTNYLQLIDDARARFSLAPIISTRGGLINAAQKVLIIISADLPNLNDDTVFEGLNIRFDELESDNISLRWLVLETPQLLPAVVDRFNDLFMSHRVGIGVVADNAGWGEALRSISLLNKQVIISR